jgi:hypothetical protein
MRRIGPIPQLAIDDSGVQERACCYGGDTQCRCAWQSNAQWVGRLSMAHGVDLAVVGGNNRALIACMLVSVQRHMTHWSPCAHTDSDLGNARLSNQ